MVIENCVNGEQGQKITVPNQFYNYGGILGGGVRARDNLTRVTGCTNYASFIEAEKTVTTSRATSAASSAAARRSWRSA